MIQIKDISKIALCCGEKPPAVMQSFTSSVTPRIGFFDTVNPALIYRVQNKNRGQLVSCFLNYDYALSNSHHRTCRGEQKQTQKTVMIVMLIGTLN